MTNAKRPRLTLLLGSPAARPEGLERFLTRAGFEVTDPESAGAEEEAPALLLLAVAAGEPGLAGRVRDVTHAPKYEGAPLLVLLAGGAPTDAVTLLAAGAGDVVRSPVDMEELGARLDAILRRRADLTGARDALRSREALFDIFQEVAVSLRAEEVFHTLVRRVGQAFSLSHCSFVLTGPGETQGRVVAVYENPAIRDLKVQLDRYPEIQEAVRTKRPVVIDDVYQHPLLAAIREHWREQRLDVNVRSTAALPVFVHGRAAGVFLLRTERGEPEMRPEDISFANTIAQAAARVLENEERRSAIYRRQVSAGTTDGLTGCGSLDALDRRLRDEFERARRYTLSFALVLLDVDGLRTINERLGQEAGDRILGELGSILQREIRAPDFAARYGGDEFALILPATDGPGATRFVERVRRVLDSHTFPDLGPARSPSLTAGVVAYPHTDALKPEDLLKLAERALARGKQGGDRIGVAGRAT